MLTEVEEGSELARIGLAGIGSLRGAHNWQNAAAAYALARSQGLDRSTIAKGLGSFAGLAHRMEQVARRGKCCSSTTRRRPTPTPPPRRWRASPTSIGSSAAARKPAGLAGLEPFFPRIARAYLIGEAAEAFGRAARRRGRPRAMRDARPRHRGSCGRCRRSREGASRAAVAGLRLLRPVRQFRQARQKRSAILVMRLPRRSPCSVSRAGRHEDHPRRKAACCRIGGSPSTG